MSKKEMSAEAYRVLRACKIPFGDFEFVRCGKQLDPNTVHALAQEIRDYLGDSRDQVFAAYNKETGHENYIRVNKGTNAFRLICQMKS